MGIFNLLGVFPLSLLVASVEKLVPKNYQQSESRHDTSRRWESSKKTAVRTEPQTDASLELPTLSTWSLHWVKKWWIQSGQKLAYRGAWLWKKNVFWRKGSTDCSSHLPANIMSIATTVSHLAPIQKAFWVDQHPFDDMQKIDHTRTVTAIYHHCCQRQTLPEKTDTSNYFHFLWCFTPLFFL